jgi:hypothetical protein
MRAAAALTGAAMLGMAALAAPLPALMLTAAAALALACSLAPRTRNWTPVATLTASAAVVECAIWPPGSAALAAEGLLVLGYLVLVDAPGSTAALWLRGQARYGVAGVAAAGVVLAALAVPPTVSPWVVLAGLAAVSAAYLVAVPRRQRADSSPWRAPRP